MNNLKLGSLFDGSGGFPLAGSMCGIKPVWAAEVEPYPIAVTCSRFHNMTHYGDVSKINGAEVEPVDIITFGSPCQDLSVAGKRAGLKHENNGDDETTRSGLFMEAIRIIKEMRDKTNGEYPTFAVWENVPGAFSSNKGEDFRTVLEEIIKVNEPAAVMPPVPKGGWAYADCYMGDGWSVAYRVFDAQYWGVPQRRKRIYLVADFRGQRAKEILFERKGLRGHSSESGEAWQTTSRDAQDCIGTDDRDREATRKYEVDQEKLAKLLRSHKGPLSNREIAEKLDKPITMVEHWFRTDKCFAVPDPDVWYPLKKLLGIETDEFDQCVTEFEFNGGNYDMRNRIYAGEVSPTLTCGSGKDLHLLPKRVYCLQGNGIDRADTAGCNGKGWNDKTCYTLNTIDRPAVAYATGKKTECLDVGFFNSIEDTSPTLLARQYKDPHLVAYADATARYIVRRLTPTECARLQGFPDDWGHPVKMESMTDEQHLFWQDVRKTHATINGKAVKDYTKEQILAWYNKLHTDSAEYKMWGNGIALPCALYVMEGIAEAT